MEQVQEEEKRDMPLVVFGDVRHNSQKTDIRKHKIYRRDVGVTLMLYMQDGYDRKLQYLSIEGENGYRSGWHVVIETLRSTLEQEGYSDFEVRTSAGWISSVGKDKKRREAGLERWECFSVTRRFEADKPSQIITEEEAFASLTQGKGVEVLGDAMVTGVMNGLAKFRLIEATQERARIGNLLVNHYGDMVKERAKKATRFEQRLAALVAEYKAEVETQTADMLNELGEDELGFEFEDGFTPDPRSVAAAKAYLPQVVAKMALPHQRSAFPRTLREDKGPITEKDVE